MKFFLLNSLIFLGVFLLLVNCENKKPEKITIDSLQVDTSQVLRSEQGQIAKNVPNWFRRLPDKEGFYFAVGKGESRRPNLARDKAVLKAQRNLLEQLSVKSANTHSGVQAVDENRPTPQVLSKTFIKKQKQIRDGQNWIVYVLLEMPIKK